jgi:hypothetical protein
MRKEPGIMARRTTTIELEEEQLQELERLAARESRSLNELVRRAVDRYLTSQADDWGARFDALVGRVQARMPADLTADQIEADITDAAAEARAARAMRRSGRDGGAAPTGR